MKIHFNNKEIDILVDTSSYRYTALQNVGTLYLYFASEEFINIPVGAYCIYKNITYYLMDPDDFKKKSSRNFEYTLVMYDIGAILGKYKCRDIVSKRLKFDYTAKPHEHLQLIVDNLNMRDSGWKVGECIEAEEKTINYNHIFCSEALPTIADTFKTEYEIDPAIKTIHLRKVEYNKGEPLPLEYGKDKGFVPGLGRSNQDGNRPVTILYVQGGEQNIDFSKYGSKELLLPKNQRLEYEGRTYVSDAEGLYIKRADTTLTDVQEDSLDCSHISPKRVGSVSNVVVSDKEKNFYDFIDSSIPDDLNFEDYVIEGNNMTVIFQSGMLAGSNKEFEVKYVHKERKFLITPQEIDGQIMPNDIYKPNLGDKYAVFGIQLPDAYICNNSTKEGASWDMFREAAKYLYENEDPKFTFKGELDSIYSKKRWLSIGGKIKLGGYILFKDPQFIPEGIKIRITSIKEYIHRPYSPIIELSNTTTGVTVSSELNKIESNEVKTDNQYKNSIQFTKRRFRDAKETISMLNDALLHFSGSISPISVQTMSLLVGDESLQFRFVNNKTNPTQVEYFVTYDSKKKVLSAPGGILQHMTIGIDTLSSGHKASEYKFWDIEKYTSPTLTETVGYYLYVKANKNGTTGSYVLSKNAIKLEGVEGYYHFLVGILNSEFEGERSFIELFGFTEIVPGRITTDKIVSTDGKTYFDLLNSIISGKIRFQSGSSGLYELSEWKDVSNLITQAQNTANTAVESAKNANTAIGNLNNYVNGAFADGIITEAEAKAIEKYINTVNNTKAAVEAAYNKLYTNSYLTGTAKTGLLNAKVTLMGSIESLISAINSAIADGKTTVAEKNNVDSKYATFNSAYADFNTAVEVANKAIQDKLKGYSDEYSQKFDEFIGGSFKDLKDNAVLKQTIIEGGYLKNDLIDTNNLIVKKVFSKDGKFKILDDGSMEGTSGTFSGYLKTNFHLVEESDAIYTKDSSQRQYGYKINKELNLKVDMEGKSDGATIILPNEIQYIGSRVILHNGCYPPYTRTVGSIRYSYVCIDDGGQLRGTTSNTSESNLLSWTDPNKIKWINGVIELIGIIEEGAYSPSLLSWKGQSNKVIPNPSNGYMYYNTEKNRNYVYWFGQWNEIPTYENNPIIWKGKLNQAPENPEKNWVYISRYDSVFIYNGIGWEEISHYVITAEKCGWSVLSMSGVSIEHIRY
nr:MAG: Prophage endopeptidase tail [Bacteriophage sp.]